MTGKEREQRKSSLPSSLIPHLYTGPVVSQPRDSSTRSTYSPPTLPAIVAPDTDQVSTVIHGEHPLRQSSVSPPFHLTPLAASISPTPASTSAPYNHARSPRRYFSFDSRPVDFLVRPSDRQQPAASDLPFHPLPTDPLAIAPLHEQQQQPFTPGSDYSNPIYHVARNCTSGRDRNLTLPMPMARQPVLHRASWEPRTGSPSLFHSDQREPPPLSMTAWRESEGGSATLLHPIPREPPILRTSWREGEAGPSSLLQTMYKEQSSSRGRRGCSQPAPLRRFSSQPEDWSGLGSEHSLRGEEEYITSGGMNFQHGMYGLPPDNLFHHWPTFPPQPGVAESQPYAYTYPPIGEVGALSLSSSAPGPSIRGGQTPELHDSSGEASQKSIAKRKRSKDVLEEGEGQRKSHASRKTAVACNFCRGRKLRCNGARPACSNCIARKYQCEYVPIQRRRGPGKAPKRSRSKKDNPNAAGTSDAYGGGSSLRASDGRPSSSAADYELEALAPELRPYASVMSLDRFSYQPPEASPPHSGPPSPEMILPREARSPQSLETSSGTGRREKRDAEIWESLGEKLDGMVVVVRSLRKMCSGRNERKGLRKAWRKQGRSRHARGKKKWDGFLEEEEEGRKMMKMMI
ncbi:hypothetical protein BDQ17DRAFT_1321132 [Cyathus striatus]|nr:hypothetical protein BDQ17DRAFT_1321132 [Cyathus striatus]